MTSGSDWAGLVTAAAAGSAPAVLPVATGLGVAAQGCLFVEFAYYQAVVVGVVDIEIASAACKQAVEAS